LGYKPVVLILLYQIKRRGGQCRASVKLLELDVRTPWGLFLGVWYAGGIDFRRFRTPSLPIFGIILGLLESKRRRSL